MRFDGWSIDLPTVLAASPTTCCATSAPLRRPATMTLFGITSGSPALGGLLLFRKGAHVAGVSNLAEGVDGAPLARRLADALP